MSKNSTSDPSSSSASPAPGAPKAKNAKPSAKKTEVIELRLSPDDKAAFMEACRMEGQSASSVLRDGISVYLKNGYFGENRRSYKMLVSGFLMGTALSAALLIAPAYLGDKIPPAAAESFAHHDSNHNGYISLSEFLAPLSNTTNIVNVQSGTINLTADTDFSDIQGDLKEKVDQLIKSRKLKGSDFQVIAQQSLEIAQQSEADRPCREAMIAQMASRRTLEFGRLDENNDNQLSPLEFSKSSFVPKREAVHAVFNGYDADKDGVLIEAEMASVPKDRIFFFQNTVKAEQQDVVLPAACRNLMESDNLAGSDKESTVIASFQALKVPSDLSKTAENFEELDENSDEKVTLDEFLRAKGVIL